MKEQAAAGAEVRPALSRLESVDHKLAASALAQADNAGDCNY